MSSNYNGLVVVDLLSERDLLVPTDGMLVYVHQTSTCYRYSTPIWLVYFTGGAVPPEFGWIFTGSPSGGPVVYTNPQPVPQNLGGIEVGDTFNSVPVQDMWTKLLYPFQYPSFSSFTIDIVAEREVGNVLPFASRIFNWSITNPQNVISNTMRVLDVTGNGTIASYQPYSSPRVFSFGPINHNEAVAHTIRLIGTNTDNTEFSRDFVIDFMWAVYSGESSSPALGPASITGLREKVLSKTSSLIYDFEPGGYKYICYPVSMGLKTSFKDVHTLFDVSMMAPQVVSITNVYGITTNYYIHRTTNILGGPLSIRVS